MTNLRIFYGLTYAEYMSDRSWRRECNFDAWTEWNGNNMIIYLDDLTPEAYTVVKLKYPHARIIV